MQSFINLSSKQAKDLDKFVHENALELYRNSEILVEQRSSFALASSLLILSLEETIKAIIIKLHSEGLKVYKIEGVQKFVKDHKIRHQVAQFIETGSGIFDIYESWIDSKKKPQKFKKQWLNNITNGVEAALKFKASYERIQKLQNFNALKNQGLYTEYCDGFINPKDIISENDFKDIKSIVDRTRNFYRVLQIIYKPTSENSGIFKRNEQLKADLALFVNEALSDFSFKIK